MNWVRVSLNALSKSCVSTVSNQEPRYVIEWVGNFYSLNAMISDILLIIVFFAEFSLNANFLRVGVIEVIFFTGNFNQKLSSTCCAFRMNDDFCLPKSCSSCCSQFNFSREERVQNKLL